MKYRGREIRERLREIAKQIKELPKGIICKKTIDGKLCYCHKWSQNGEKHIDCLSDDEAAALSEKIKLRRELQTEKDDLKKELSELEEERDLKYTLMHKDVKVLDLEITEIHGRIKRVGTIYAPEHLPFGVTTSDENDFQVKLYLWWDHRNLSDSRPGFKEVLDLLDSENQAQLATRAYGLSLTDQYWLLPEGSDMTWKKINCFENEFSNDIGGVLLYGVDKKDKEKEEYDFHTPNLTLRGDLPKRWEIINGKRCLVKGGTPPYYQQPFNEVIASKLMDRLGIPHVSYSLIWRDGLPYSVCEDFINKNTEFVPASDILLTKKKHSMRSIYQHLIERFTYLEIAELEDIHMFIDQMIVVDYLMRNDDRDMNNFGAIRDAETLEWRELAPIYDCGNSLCYNVETSKIGEALEDDSGCLPFKNHFKTQLDLVSEFDWLDFDFLADMDQVIIDTFSVTSMKCRIDKNRINAIIKMMYFRIVSLYMYIDTHPYHNTSSVDDVNFSVALGLLTKEDLKDI